MGEPATKEILSLEELEAAGSFRTGRKHILSILVENKPGVLTRISGLFARRGFNIDTLAVGPTDDETISRITLTLDGAVQSIDQVTKQLHKLVNVLKIRDLDPVRDDGPGACAVQDLSRWCGACRGHAGLRDIPRQDRRREQAHSRGRGNRHAGEDRRVRALGPAVRSGRDGTNRRDRDSTRSHGDLNGAAVRMRRAAPDAGTQRSRLSPWLSDAAEARLRARLVSARRQASPGTPVLVSVTEPLAGAHDPSAIVIGSRKAGDPWFCIEQPARDSTAPRWSRRSARVGRLRCRQVQGPRATLARSERARAVRLSRCAARCRTYRDGRVRVR